MSGVYNSQDIKPTIGDPGSHIYLKVRSQDGTEVFFRIKRSTKLKKLMSAYCIHVSVDLNSIAFLFQGRHIHGEQTSHELGMEDGDEIGAVLHQPRPGDDDQLMAENIDLREETVTQLKAIEEDGVFTKFGGIVLD